VADRGTVNLDEIVSSGAEAIAINNMTILQAITSLDLSFYCPRFATVALKDVIRGCHAESSPAPCLAPASG